MNITFDPEKHEYRIDGQVVISVTQALKEAGLIDATWFNDYACERGKLVHEACALYDRDDLDESSLDPELVPYVDAWKKFRDDSGFEPEKIEQIVFNSPYNYIGTVDVLGKINDQRVIIDRKTGSPQPWHALQLAAYAEADCFQECPRRFSVELNTDERYHLIEHKNRNDIKVFLSALAVVQWKRNNGGKQNGMESKSESC